MAGNDNASGVHERRCGVCEVVSIPRDESGTVEWRPRFDGVPTVRAGASASRVACVFLVNHH